MRHLRHSVVAAVAVAICVAPVAVARAPHGDGHGAVLRPAKPKWLGEVWAQIYSLPAAENPFVGNGNPCVTVGRRVIDVIGDAACTIDQGTAYTFGFGSAWSNIEDPFPMTEAEQRAVGRAFDEATFREIHVTVDGGMPVDIRTSRFELFSPQRTVVVPADNIGGVPGPKIVTLTAHAWQAVLRNLRPGRHTIVRDALLPDGEHLIHSATIIVVARRARDR